MHTDIAARQIAPHLASDGVVVSMQNGFNEERIAAFVGVGRTISAFVNFGADYQEPAVSSTAVRARCSSENSTAH